MNGLAPNWSDHQSGQGEVRSWENSPEAKICRNEGTAGRRLSMDLLCLSCPVNKDTDSLLFSTIFSRLFVQRTASELTFLQRRGGFTLASGLEVMDPLGKGQASLPAARYKRFGSPKAPESSTVTQSTRI